MFKNKPDAKKSEATRKLLFDTAMKLFLKQGFEETTMRDIARAAGLAPGAAYYYVASKEHLVFDFYEKSYLAHLPEVETILKKETKLADRLAGVISAHLKVSEPYHEIGRVLYKVAADPTQALSPFSEPSRELREKNIAVMGRVLEGSKIGHALADQLPELLWMFKMACVLYWVHDRSPERKKTYRLVEELSALVAGLLRVATLPLLRGYTKRLIEIYFRYKTF
ncbi:MAG: TetR family transcriptional regulator [Spirochaetia bacterium]|nr:TetR family transcriptional regulator [Spirochaetia bacterium]